MARINLLPWRDELREKKRKLFLVFCGVAALIGAAIAGGIWFFYEKKLQDQQQANQLIQSSKENLDLQLQALDGLDQQRNAIVERMKLIQGLQGQRPVSVRLIDELVRVIPKDLYFTKIVRTGNKISIEGRAESPNTVAELLRNLEASPWYRNAFMSSFLAVEDNKEKASSSVVPRVEERYGQFTVTTDLEEIADFTATTTTVQAEGAAQ